MEKAFISYSLKDETKVKKITETFIHTLEKKSILIEPYFAIDAFSTKTTSDKIKKAIKECDFAIVFLSKNSYSSQFTQQEIGAFSILDKVLFLISIDDCKKKPKGFIFGKEPLSCNGDEIDVDKLVKSIIEETGIKINTLPIKEEYDKYKNIIEKEKEKEDVLTVAAIIALALLLGWVISTAIKKPS